MNFSQYSILFSILLFVPIIAYAQSTINDDFTTTDDNLSGLIPDDDTIGPVGIVSELYKAHADLSGIMENHSTGSYEHDYPFTITYVDEDNQKLVVGMHPMAAIAGIEYTTNEIQQVLETTVPIKIIYAEFIPETRPSPTLTYYEGHCTPDVLPGFINVCKVYVDRLIRDGINPADIGPYTIFLDPFSNMRNWNTSGDEIEDDDLGSGYGVIPGYTTRNDVATNDDECETCVITMRNSINMSEYDNATLTFWKLVDREFESGDYLKVEVHNGVSWTEKFKWTSGNNSWQQHTLTLDGTAFKMRITASIADDDHKFGIDDIVLKVENDPEPVTPTDTTSPIITVPADITGIPRNYSLGYYAELTVTATDDVDGTVNVTCSHSTGYFSIGVTTVSCSATDVSGNRATASFTITVMDNRPVDTDGDGFHDGIDQCPTVPSSSNYGCPLVVPPTNGTTPNPEVPTIIPEIPTASTTVSVRGGDFIGYQPTTTIDLGSGGITSFPATDLLGRLGMVVSKHVVTAHTTDETENVFVSQNLTNSTRLATFGDIIHPTLPSRQLTDASFVLSGDDMEIIENSIQTRSGTILNITSYNSTMLVENQTPLKLIGHIEDKPGFVLNLNVTVRGTSEIGILREQAFANYNSTDGDSGGPVISGNDTIVGAHVGRVCYFTLEGFTTEASVCDYIPPDDDARANSIPIFTPWENIRTELNLR